jgi:predicted porin
MKLVHPLMMTMMAWGFCSLAQAQSVSIYGVVDVGVEHITNVSGGGGLTRVPSNTGTVPSKLGFRGTEDLGDGLTAVFTLEMGIAPDQGTLGQGGRAWGRQAFVGLSGPWGTVALGRQYTMLFWSMEDADILGPNLYGSSSLDAALPNARTDNTVSYKGRFGAFTVGATYSFGRDTVDAGPSPAGTNCPGEGPSDSRACKAWSVLVKYDANSWGAALAYDTANGRTVGPPPDAVFGGLDSSDKTDSRVSANGWLKIDNVKLGAGLVRRSNDGDALKPKSDLWYAGVSYPLTSKLVAEVEWFKLHYRGVSDHDSSLLAARLVYAFSKRTAVYAQVAGIDNGPLATVSVSSGASGSAPAPGRSQRAVNVGLRHSF